MNYRMTEVNADLADYGRHSLRLNRLPRKSLQFWDRSILMALIHQSLKSPIFSFATKDLLTFWIEPFIEYGYDSNVSESATPLLETCVPCGSNYLGDPRFLPIVWNQVQRCGSYRVSMGKFFIILKVPIWQMNKMAEAKLWTLKPEKKASSLIFLDL